MTISEIVEALHAIAPPELAESWDNVGLLVGDPDAPCRKAFVALDVDTALLRRAAKAGAQLVVSHHPPILQPLRRVTADDGAGGLVLEAARRGLALAAAHTNYDVAPGGVSDVLADLLGLNGVEPLALSDRSGLAKIVVFTPPGDVETVIRALSGVGAGVIGNYRECTFRSPGIGTFLGLEGSRPTIGQAGRHEEVEELRLEAVVPLALAGCAVAAARAAHSYEEPAIDVYPLEGGSRQVGLGRCGQLPRPMKAGRLVERIKKCLGVPTVRVAGKLSRWVERVAVCGGSGGKYVGEAVRRGCGLFLTGDVTHHQALEALGAGLVVVDAGHGGTEWPAVPVLAKRLGELCPGVRFQAVAPKAAGPLEIH